MSYKQTKIWTVDNVGSRSSRPPNIKEAALLIKNGDVVAFPTETVYGLGANALSEEAVQGIFTAKGRPSDNPLIVHIAAQNQLEDLVLDIPEKAKVLMNSFWPGPLTIIFRKKDTLARAVTAGLETVGVRIPNHPVALALLEEAGVPVAAPSANLSGKPSPTTAKHVFDDLAGRIAGVVDGGVTGVGLESTVLDCSQERPIMYRPGGVTKEEIEAVIGCIDVDPALVTKSQTPKSPGMKYTHYAPKATLILVEELEDLQKHIDEARAQGKKVGVLTTSEGSSNYQADVVISCGTRYDLSTVAAQLFGCLRDFDNQEIDLILSEVFPEEGVGAAIMNRLNKAAGGHIIKG
ncbi:L-threonylcarbamoyladenylate synthase [Bacillus solitudinis]|uniref:L-threonylcarbamoyladenylate synthase n=1 Tax=Bacillus solitudinis TaxID=2014074 RepID=UPI000C24DFAE|nr:L-threonylcarbamoyladenylate synthase [Bacillus solitudinis]